MTISPTTPTSADLAVTWADDLADLTDRRRLLLAAVFGVDLAPGLVDAVFDRRAQPLRSSSSSTTMRSGGRSSSTVAR